MLCVTAAACVMAVEAAAPPKPKAVVMLFVDDRKLGTIVKGRRRGRRGEMGNDMCVCLCVC